MKVSLLHPPPLDFIERHVAAVAAICYAADPANTRRVERLVALNHLSPFRHWLLTLLMQGISIPCARQLFRHVHTVQDSGEPVFEGVMEESRRYVAMETLDFVTPPSVLNCEDVQLAKDYNDHMFRGAAIYDRMVNAGIKKEDARFVLPQATTTNVIVSANPEAWFHFCQLRTTKKTQWELREVAWEIKRLITPYVPSLFNSIEWEE